SYFSLFCKISEYLQTTLNTKIKHSVHTRCVFLVYAYAPQSKNQTIEYFSKFPLLGKVSLDYELWREINMAKLPGSLQRKKMGDSAKSKAFVTSLKMHKNKLFTGSAIYKNLNFYLG